MDVNDSQHEICILCDDKLLPTKSTIVKERAIASLIEASKKKKDKKHLELQKCKFINIHSSCHTLYLRIPSIAKSLKKRSKSTPASSRGTRNSDANEFDFSSLCFFCSEEKSKRGSVRNLEKDCTRLKILNTIEERKVGNKQLFESDELLYNRLSKITDLSTVKARYHPYCFRDFYRPRNSNVRGRQKNENLSKSVEYVIDYISQNEEQCQFSLNEILSTYEGEKDIPLIKDKLQRQFGSDIVFHKHDDNIFCFRDAKNNIPDDVWYELRESKDVDERQRIVKMAANIILQDIRAHYYDMKNYKAPSSFLDDIMSDIPETLKSFLDVLITSNKSKNISDDGNKKWQNRIATIAHIMIASVRPRQFLSPLLLGLSSMIHKKHGSRGLIDALSYLGLCSSYRETLLFESSIVNEPEHFSFECHPFIQFVFDNADHNTNTLDGHKTFHAMGGIMCITPYSFVKSNETIPRLKSIPAADVLGKFGFIPLKHFQKGSSLGLQNVKVKDLNVENPISQETEINSVDLLWFYGKRYKADDTVGWNGFLEKHYSTNTSNKFDISKIVPLPFVNAPPSNYDTILTVLIKAALQCKEYGQKTCFVTFDQPLYLKAREILASIDLNNDEYNLCCVIVRLGGFHMLMSYLGSIGYIMEGSGLKEAFSSIFAEISAEKALTGHAFSRAVRGHLLTQATLAGIVLSSVHFSENEVELLNNIVTKVNDNWECNREKEQLLEIKNKFQKQLELLKKNGPTAKLWLQYFEMVSIMKKFIESERSGNWKLHLECVLKMLPYFHASGHYLYAKSSQLYLQDMLQLEPNVNMDVSEFHNFCNSGYFSMRRSNKFWSGIWSDMTIEQVLMRSMKSSGGLTHGRGITDSVLAKWILSTIVLTEVCNEIEKFCNVTYITSQQHVDTRISRIARDKSDLQKLQEFFETYDPFPDTNCIMSIYSGVIGDEKINCFDAYEVGTKLLASIVNKDFASIKFQRKNKVLSLRAINSSITIENETLTINPLLLFQRISLNVEKKEDMKEYLKHELSPIPLSLFDEGGMRKTQKSAFYDTFETVEDGSTSGNTLFVIDGGFLIHRVIWHQNDQMVQILKQYVSYVQQNFSTNSFIIFDGYPELETASTTKSCERLRRKTRSVGREIAFDIATRITFSKENFLSNDKNKKKLIALLCQELQTTGFRTKTAEADADLLIVSTAIDLAVNCDNAVKIIGQDIDLLVLLSHLAPTDKNILFVKCGTGRASDEIFNANSFKYPELKPIILFLHAFTGCDTTSCFYKQGKFKLINAMKKNEKLQELENIFYNENADPELIAQSENEIIAAMYATKNESGTLEELRFLHFQKSSIKCNFKLESLPPTEGASRQHSFRVFYQIQEWLGNSKDATQWGWKSSPNGLQPVLTTSTLIPDELIKKITCKCTTGCKGACGCRKHGLKCSDLCSGCLGQTCTNTEKKIVEDLDLDVDGVLNENMADANEYPGNNESSCASVNYVEMD